MSAIIQRRHVMDALAAAKVKSFTVHESHSGRGVRGKPGFGVALPDLASRDRFIASLRALVGKHDKKLLDKAALDSMNLGVIVHFPGVSLEG
jgi:hypothetical protein